MSFLPVHFPVMLAEASPQWTLGFEGISPALALGMFALLTVATVVVYARWVPRIPGWRKGAMVLFRILAALVLTLLLAKPVLHLSLKERVRQPLLVLVDSSESMQFTDRRNQREDLQRAAIASGAASPEGGLGQNLASPASSELGEISRLALLQKLAANDRMNLWARLSENADLQFYQFGRTAFAPAAAPVFENGKWTSEAAASFFQQLQPTESATAIGESLRQVLQEPRAQAPVGVLLITDGGNNTGTSAIEAAQIALEQKTPLFIYGLGVTSPLDLLVRDVQAQKLAFAGERMEVRAHVISQSFAEQRVVATLKANGETVDEQELTLGGDRDLEVLFHFTPKTAGEVKLEVSVPLLPGEAGKENNVAANTMRVTDTKFQVLLIEQEPRWDFRYLLDYLQRDPRLEVKCVMIDGEPGLEQTAGSPFLPKLPEDRETFFKSHVLILGDVNPEALGQQRMETIAEWVEAGGGIIFQTGSNYNPRSYVGTPLEALLPVVPDTVSPKEWVRQRAAEPFRLELTRLGKESPYLQMDPNPEVNQEIWAKFQGVRWTAPVSRVKTGAEVLLVDTRADREGRYGQLPVFAMQGYGAGKCVYFGTDETYRWRSRTGEKYYSILWGQIMQTLSLQLLEGASPLTQLKSDRKQYVVGDRIVISGNAYTEGFSPLLQPTLEGTLKNGAADTKPFNLLATEKNTFRGDFLATTPGVYTYVTTRDPDGIVTFEV
ncbi:MAG TPA: hypothetical protein VK956_06550, partial [Verrucomicrobium sp.]|nr:hypothetical protein [Verrucomicrobium sp.]